MNENYLPIPENEPPKPARRGPSTAAVSAIVIVVLLLLGFGLRGFLARTGPGGGDMTCNISERFENVRVETVSADVRFRVGGSDTCIVEYKGPSRMRCTAEVKNGTLTVAEKPARRWPFGLWGLFGTHRVEVTVFLPERQYDELSIETASGDIEAPSGGVFRELSVSSTSGDQILDGVEADSLTAQSTSGNVSVQNSRLGSLDVSTTSGDQKAASTDIAGHAGFEAVSGNISVQNGSFGSLAVSTTSGDQDIASAAVDGHASFSAVSGNISLLASDAGSLEFSTTSGDVCTELLTPKEYITETTSGDVSVPVSAPGAGRCSVTTVSGDITCQ